MTPLEKIRTEADWHESRAERLRMLAAAGRYDFDFAEKVEYQEGWAHALNWALSELREETTPRKCACGEQLDASGEHDGGYGAWCG